MSNPFNFPRAPLPEIYGQRFGQILVLAEVPKMLRRHYQRREWYCVCDCGAFMIQQTDRLTTGSAKSCGCLKYAKDRRTKAFRKESAKRSKDNERQPDALDFMFGTRPIKS